MVQRSIIALLANIYDIITAARELAGETAMIRKNIAPIISRIALLTRICNSISAVCRGAVGSAAIRPSIIVTNCTPHGIWTGTLIAFFTRLENTIATDKGNFDRAPGTATVIVITLC